MKYIDITYLGLRVIARVVDGEVGKVDRKVNKVMEVDVNTM